MGGARFLWVIAALMVGVLADSVSKIAFASCYGLLYAENPQIWDRILDQNPELFIWTGDAIYADLNI
jgi:phosphodiesterase/alkaline phosphatase D-like protein